MDVPKAQWERRIEALGTTSIDHLHPTDPVTVSRMVRMGHPDLGTSALEPNEVPIASKKASWPGRRATQLCHPCVSHRTLATKRHVWYQPRHCIRYSREGTDSEEPLFQKRKLPSFRRIGSIRGHGIEQPGKLPRNKA